MNTMKEKINDLNLDLKTVLISLNNLDDGNYDDNVAKIKNVIPKLQQTNKNRNLKMLLDKSDEYQTMIKQINEKFDSIISEKKKLQKIISEELSKTINKKKLINYQR